MESRPVSGGMQQEVYVMWAHMCRRGSVVGMEAVPEEAEVPEVGGIVAGCAPDQAPGEAQEAEHL